MLVCAQQWERLHRRPLQRLHRSPPVQLFEKTLNAQAGLLQKILLCSFTPQTVVVSLPSRIEQR